MRKASERKLNRVSEGEKTCGIKAALLASAGPIFKLWGNSVVEVENYNGVLEISQSKVRLYTGIGILYICGEELLVELADPETFVCRGRIFSAGYEKESSN